MVAIEYLPIIYGGKELHGVLIPRTGVITYSLLVFHTGGVIKEGFRGCNLKDRVSSYYSYFIFLIKLLFLAKKISSKPKTKKSS